MCTSRAVSSIAFASRLRFFFFFAIRHLLNESVRDRSGQRLAVRLQPDQVVCCRVSSAPGKSNPLYIKTEVLMLETPGALLTRRRTRWFDWGGRQGAGPSDADELVQEVAYGEEKEET